MSEKLKLYHAMIWGNDLGAIGRRVTVLAENLSEAKKKLESEHGAGRVYNLYNEEEAALSR